MSELNRYSENLMFMYLFTRLDSRPIHNMKPAFIIIALYIGFVTAAEIRAKECGLKLGSREFVKLAWRTLDATGDKNLQFDEIENTMSALLQPNKFNETMFAAVDLNKDGVLSGYEAMAGTYVGKQSDSLDIMISSLKKAV